MRRFWEMVDSEAPAVEQDNGVGVAVAVSVLALVGTSMARTLLGINLPFLFCLAAVLFNASRRGLSAGLVATCLSLTGTILISGTDVSIINIRNTSTVLLFCIVVSFGGDRLIKLRFRERQLAANASSREHILQVMFNNTPAVTLIVDRKGDILTANDAACRLFESCRDWLSNQSVDTLFGRQISYSDTINKISLSSKKEIYLRLTSTPLTINNNDFSILYIRDETRTIESAEELAATQRKLYRIARATSLGQLGSSIAHELNQPLSFIANYAGAAQAILSKDNPDLLAARSAIYDTLSQVFRTAAVLKRLRNFVGRKPPTLIPINARAMLEDAARMGALAVDDARAKLDADFSATDLTIFADVVQLQQVVLNLMMNAADAVRDRDDRRILLCGAQCDSGDVMFAVEDSGDGIAPELRQDIFTPFQSTKIDGVGIGLAICRTIVEGHGGRIWCDGNTALGGARFVFTVPRRDLGDRTNA